MKADLMNDQLGNLDHIQRMVIDLAIQFGPKVVVAILIIIAGVFAGRWVGKAVDRGLKKFNLEPPVRQLLVRIVRIFVLTLFAIMALQNLGVELLPLIAGLGVAGAGIALAMQGVLSNMMAGLTIIFTRPFRIGEYISIVSEEGVVDTISLFSTVLSHADQSKVVIPNRKIVGEILHNYGYIRQIEILVGVAYDTDLDMAIAVADKVLQADTHILKEPPAVIGIGALSTISVSISIRPWVNVPDYAATKSELTKTIVKTFRSKNIVIPITPFDDRFLLGKN
jgi:small conductance mechanosensitive channel